MEVENRRVEIIAGRRRNGVRWRVRGDVPRDARGEFPKGHALRLFWREAERGAGPYHSAEAEAAARVRFLRFGRAFPGVVNASGSKIADERMSDASPTC